MNIKDKQNLIILLLIGGVVIYFIIKNKKNQPNTRSSSYGSQSSPPVQPGQGSYGSQSSPPVQPGQGKGDIPIEETPQFKKWGRGMPGERRFDKDGCIYVWNDIFGWAKAGEVPVTSPLTEEAANTPQFYKWGYGKVGDEKIDDNGDIYIWQDYNGWSYGGNVNEQTDNDGGKDGGGGFIDAYGDYLLVAADVATTILPLII